MKMLLWLLPAVALSGQPHIVPDPVMTPGVANASIAQANIGKTICNPRHWSTKSIRPPSKYTTALKRKQIVLYRYADTNLRDYEEDHLISLELGGHPRAPGNLWPESYKTTPNARDKDRVENFLHAQAGRVSLRDAQKKIATNWVAVLATMPKGAGVYHSHAAKPKARATSAHARLSIKRRK
jgi:hypothetical protein